MQGGSPQETRRKDLISHHILRLAYCRWEQQARTAGCAKTHWLSTIPCQQQLPTLVEVVAASFASQPVLLLNRCWHVCLLCRSAELRAWLLQHEALLFKYRFAELGSAEQVSSSDI